MVGIGRTTYGKYGACVEITDGVRTMTANIVLEMSYADTGSLHEGALIATAAVLFVFILIINLLFSLLKRKGGKA